MKRVFDLHEACELLSELLERAHAGEELVIEKEGRPYARLCPLESPVARTPGFLRGKLGNAFFEPLPEDELSDLER